MRKVLVTGGLGYIGSHTAVELIGQDYEVVLADNLSNSRKEAIGGIESICKIRPEWINVDLSDPSAFEDCVARKEFDAIIHFAAFKAVGESVAEPLKYYRNNLGSLLNLLAYKEEHPNCAFIFSSSCTVYGQAEELPIKETAATQVAQSPYGNTKQVGEEIIRDTVQARSQSAISLRYFNPVGAHSSGQIGELPLGTPQNLVPFITQSAAGIRGPLNVFGNDYPTRDGTAIRDYIHVVDLAKAHIVAMERLLTNEVPVGMEVYNLGTGTGSTVLEVIDSFCRATGETLDWEYADRRPGDVVAAYADTGKAAEVLGWSVEKSLDDAMVDAWKWQRTLA